MTKMTITSNRRSEGASTQIRRLARAAKFSALRGFAYVSQWIGAGRLPRSANSVGVLMFHRVAPEVPGAQRLTWNVTPDRFRRQLAELLDLGFQPWSLHRLSSTLSGGGALPGRAFVVTFDDGYASVHDYAWPILRELRVPATIFLATHFIGKNEPFPFDDWSDRGAANVPSDRWLPLSIGQVKAMMGDPLITFGSHTHMHEDYRGSPVAFSQDLGDSFAMLQTEFGIQAPSFAFPFGACDNAMIDIVRGSGASCALTSESALVTAHADLFQLGRFGVDEYETGRTIGLKLGGWYEVLKGRRERLAHGK